MSIVLRPACAEDADFAYEVKRDAMGAYITVHWGWDENYQRRFHAKRWVAKPWSIICHESQKIGTVSLHWHPTHLQFGEFYISSSHRRRGLGSQVLAHALQDADARRIETRLEFLKWNPVGSLYLRNGFRVTGENDIHFFAVRYPARDTSA